MRRYNRFPFVLAAVVLVVFVASIGSFLVANDNNLLSRKGEDDNSGITRRLAKDAPVTTTISMVNGTDSISRQSFTINTFTNFLRPSDASYGLSTIDNGLFLADGISARQIAIAGHKVPYADGTMSEIPFHPRPDGAAIFADPRPSNPGGYIYVSNSEIASSRGGVGAITFDQQGKVMDYRMLLTGTTTNCNGGKTHFGAWISCEEDWDFGRGQAWQVDPTGEREPQPITLGSDGGVFEAFAYDIRDTTRPYFYLTEDQSEGALQRWTPDSPDFSKPWELLFGSGQTDYLLLSPSDGTFSWTRSKNAARQNAKSNYPNSEGIDVSGNMLFFVSKATKSLYELNLDTSTYVRTSTSTGLFEGQPDIIRNILAPDSGGSGGTLLYFTEDGGQRAGIHARDGDGNFYAVLESSLFDPESTGLAITPDGKRLYFCYQNDGILYELRRTDGQSFRASTLNLKSHPIERTDEERRRRFRRYT